MKENRKKNIKIFKENIKRKFKISGDNRPQIERRMTFQQEHLQNINNPMEEEIEEYIPNNIDENIENNIDNNISDLLEEIEITEDIINKARIEECPICLEDYSFNNKICYLPCFHVFHSKCIKNWLNKSKNCPLCNTEVKFE